ncbi:MAG TPA: hypothetical protein PLS00_10090, partial [Niabella sp.]|nr:hypothetical protein [Niabella sp.]
MNILKSQSREFVKRHIGPNESETKKMLHETGFNSIDELIDKTVPPGIRMTEPLRIPTPL